MTNDTRTLLCGLPGAGFVAGEGEEYTPPAYRPPALPQSLLDIRAVLFGRAPDRRTILYRMRQFMALLDATGLGADLTAVDPRRTDAGVRAPNRGFELTPGIDTEPLGHNYPLALIGDGPVEDGAGRTEHIWILEVLP